MHIIQRLSSIIRIVVVYITTASIGIYAADCAYVQSLKKLAYQHNSKSFQPVSHSSGRHLPLPPPPNTEHFSLPISSYRPFHAYKRHVYLRRVATQSTKYNAHSSSHFSPPQLSYSMPTLIFLKDKKIWDAQKRIEHAFGPGQPLPKASLIKKICGNTYHQFNLLLSHPTIAKLFRKGIRKDINIERIREYLAFLDNHPAPDMSDATINALKELHYCLPRLNTGFGEIPDRIERALAILSDNLMPEC